MFEPELEIIKRAAAVNGLYLDQEQLSKFSQYYHLLLEGNKKCNLTAITEPAEVAIKHFYDSLTCLMTLDIPRGALVVDVGTGAGFPGLPMKIGRPDIQLTLLDSLGKRVDFLERVVTSLGFDGVKVIKSRAEDYGRSAGGREIFALAMSRAVADLRVLAELCLPLVRLGGMMVALKGPDVGNEAKGARAAIDLLGGGEIQVIETELPHHADRRSIVVINKTNSTPEKYPRRAGIPAKRPL